MSSGGESLQQRGGGDSEQRSNRIEFIFADDLNVVGFFASRPGRSKLDIAQEQDAGKDADDVHEGNAENGQVGLPFGKALSVGGLVLPRVTHVKVQKVANGEPFQTQLRPLFLCQSGQHLIENVVVFLHGKRADDAALVQEVAVDLSPVESAVRHLDLDEVADAARLAVGSRLGRAKGP